jgi:hypothetical protein
MLGRGQALAGMPYQSYMGPLTAGASPLQQQAFSGLASLSMPSTITGAGMGYGGSSGFPAVPTYQPTPSFGGGLLFPVGGVKPGENMQDLLKLGQQQPGYASTTYESDIMGSGEPLPPQQMEAVNNFFASKGGDLAQRLSNLTGFKDSGTRQIDPMFAGARGPDDRPLEEGRPVTQEDIERFRATSQPGGLGMVTGAPQQQPMQQGAPTTQQQIASLMNPYIEQALNPQLEAAKRQAEIQAQNLQSQFGKAGAYGGSRQGVAEAEMQRGLLDRMAGLTGQGYQQAYDKAVDLLGKERSYGLDVLREQQAGGATERAIESQGIAADIKQFEEERDYPYKQVQFMQSLLQGLPLETQSYSYYEPSGLQSLLAGGSDIASILDLLSRKA